jgi:hypothetical protein
MLVDINGTYACAPPNTNLDDWMHVSLRFGIAITATIVAVARTTSQMIRDINTFNATFNT